jgi:hypothetical protein
MLAVALLLAGLAGCSTAQYGEPIKEFSDATTQATAAVREMNQTLGDATLEYALQSASKPEVGTLKLVEQSECSAFVPGLPPEQAVRCRSVFEFKDIMAPDGKPLRIGREQYTNPMGNMVAVMAAIQKYAANLAEVQTDKTAEAVNASIDKIQTNLVELVKATDPKAQIPAGLPAAAGNGVKWIFGQYIESVKLDALQKATKAALGPLDDAAVAFKSFAESAKGLISVTVMADARDAMFKRPDNSVGSNRAALRQANAYDDFLTSPLSPMFDNLVAAHKRLEEALNGDGDVSIQDVFDRLEEIKAQAEQIAKIANDLSAALKAHPA